MNQLPDLLLVAHRVPYPPDKGDRIRGYHLLKFLSRHASVHLAALADEPVPPETLQALETYCRCVAIAPLGPGRWLRGISSMIRGRSISEGAFHCPGLARTLKAWSEETPFHAGIASASSVASYLRLGRLAQRPAVIDLMDVDSQKWHDYAASSRWPKSMLYRAEGNRLRRWERHMADWAEALTLVSEAETGLFRQFAPKAPVHAITNGVYLDYFRPEPESPKANGCVFVGAFDYRPNVDAACWFAREVWPEVIRERPDARFRIVGRNPVKAVRRLSGIPGVEVIGTVPDVRPHVREAAVAIAPLRIARGLQNKVLEALAMGKAIVASPQALAGFRDDVPAVVAANRSEWLAALGRLLDDAQERRRLGELGRSFAEEHHDWDRCLEPFMELLGLASRSNAECGMRNQEPSLLVLDSTPLQVSRSA